MQWERSLKRKLLCLEAQIKFNIFCHCEEGAKRLTWQSRVLCTDPRLPRRLRAPRNDEVLVAGFCLLFLIIGISRMQISEFNIANDKLSKLNEGGQVVLSGVVSDEPDVRETSQKIKVKVGTSDWRWVFCEVFIFKYY